MLRVIISPVAPQDIIFIQHLNFPRKRFLGNDNIVSPTELVKISKIFLV